MDPLKKKLRYYLRIFPNSVFFPEMNEIKSTLGDQIDQISPPPFVKHVLAPQNEFGIQKILGQFTKLFGNWKDPPPYMGKMMMMMMMCLWWLRLGWDQKRPTFIPGY